MAERITHWSQLKLSQTDRAALIGATGCGKTTLARYLIEDSSKPFSITYDAKISDNIGQWNHTFYYDFYSLTRSDRLKYPRLVYRPDIYESVDPNAQDEFFQWVYHRKRCRLYVDEAYALLGGTNPSFFLQAVLSRGRERGISAMIATQRPKRIPLITLSESENIYIFRLNLPGDREAVEEITGIDRVDQSTLRNYEFFYFNALTGYRSGKLKLNISRGIDNGRTNTPSLSSKHSAKNPAGRNYASA